MNTLGQRVNNRDIISLSIEAGAEQFRWNSFLGKVTRRLRQERPVATANEYGWYLEKTRYRGRPYDLPLAWLVTNGCSRDRAGSCTMCNFGCGGGVDDASLMWQFEQIMRRVSGSPMVYVTPLGSMFDDSEVPPHVRNAMFQRLAASNVRVFGTESRPETITDERMREFRSAFSPDVVLQVGLGVETANPYIQLNCINKGLLEEDTLNALRILKQNNIVALVHVLLKPLFVTESEAIEDSIDTINWAFEHGADGVIFCMTNIKPYTLTHWLQERNAYRVPYVWSGLKVLRSINPEYRKRCTLSGLYSGVQILQTAYNCPNCTSAIISGLQRFSMRPDPAILDELDRYSCACKTDWQASLDQPAAELPERLPGCYEYIGRTMFGADWWLAEQESVFCELEKSRRLWEQYQNCKPPLP